MRGKDPHRRHSPPAAILAGILAPLMLEAVWAHEEAPLVRHLGCFRDADMGGGERVVRSIEHQTEHVQGMYKSRPAAVEACAAAAYKLGFPGFAIQDGGSCHSDATIFQRYDMWGTAAELPPPYTCTHGKGGLWANDVYEIIGRKADFQEYPDDEM